MKVRFYRGPWDGKVKHLADHLTTVQVPITKPRVAYIGPDQHYIGPETLVAGPLTALYTKTRHTHPDGSVFFEWSRPKGSRI